MDEREMRLRNDAGDVGEELADELASKVLAAAAAFGGTHREKGVAIASLTATLILKQVEMEADE